MSGQPHERRVENYRLIAVQDAVALGYFRITPRVLKHLSLVGWDTATIQECVASLRPEDFYKSQRHHSRADAWLDIYKPVYNGERIYLKFTLHENGTEYLVLSFCRDGARH